MKEIMFIAPYKRLYADAKKIISRESIHNVDVVTGDLDEGLRQAYIAAQSGTNIIISRGGTYNLIKDNIQIPLVELKISAYDILYSLKHIIDRNDSIAVIGAKNVIYGYDLLEDAKKMNIKKIYIDETSLLNEDYLENKVLECAHRGTKIFVVDAVTSKVCSRLGFESIILESGENSIKEAIKEANTILESYRSEVERNKRYLALFDCVRDGVVTTDNQNKVIGYNLPAEIITGFKKEEVLGRPIDSLSLPSSITQDIMAGKNIVDQVVKMNHTKVLFSNIPIYVNETIRGAVVTLQDIKKLQNYEKDIRKKLLGKGFTAKYSFEAIIHKSKQIADCIQIAKKFSQYNSTVLIYGNSGVGKELFAQSIHNESKRKNEVFVAVNCAALPESLIESELFGYAEGAFTGSKKGGKAGMFEMAHKGTIFLDEIGELPLAMQGRLLRAIQEREIMRIGDSKIMPVDIRIICATNKNLEIMVEEGRFREDLFYRINTLFLKIPDLKDRKDDIAILTNHFVKKYTECYRKDIAGLTGDAVDYLASCQLKGNVRELEGMVERAVIICEGPQISKADFTKGYDRIDTRDDLSLFQDIIPQNTLPSLKELEQRYIRQVYNSQSQSATKTCDILGINRSTLWRKLQPGNAD